MVYRVRGVDTVYGFADLGFRTGRRVYRIHWKIKVYEIQELCSNSALSTASYESLKLAVGSP